MDLGTKIICFIWACVVLFILALGVKIGQEQKTLQICQLCVSSGSTEQPCIDWCDKAKEIVKDGREE